MKRLRSNLALEVRPAPDYVDALSLAGGGGAESLTVPTGATVAIFGYSAGTVYVNARGTATVPGDTTDGTASECMPTGYEVTPGGTLSFIAAAGSNPVVTVAYYNAPGTGRAVV